MVAKDPIKLADKKELMLFLADKVAKWWLPDASEFVTEILHTANGKINKVALRQKFSDYEFKSVIETV